MLNVVASLLFVAVVSADSIVQLELYQDASCSLLNGTKPYAYTNLCKNADSFMPSLVDDGLGFNLFSCSEYTAYPYQRCSDTTAQGSGTMAPSPSGFTYEPTGSAPPSKSFPFSTCRLSKESAYYFKFSCITASIVTKIETFSSSTCETKTDADLTVISGYFRPCTRGIDTEKADLSVSSDRFTQFGTVVQHESWDNSATCEANVAHSTKNHTAGVCEQKVGEDGTILYITSDAVLASSSLMMMIMGFLI